MLIPSSWADSLKFVSSLSRRVNANSQHIECFSILSLKLIKKGEC